MRIGIDARFLGIRQKGLGRYTQRLVEHLERISPQEGIEFVVFLRQDNFHEYEPKKGNFKKVLADYRWYTFSEQLFFPWLLYRHSLDLVHFPHFNVPILYFKKFIVTVHDLTLIHFPTVRNSTLNPVVYAFKFLAYKLVIFLALARSERVIAISQFTKEDILKNYGLKMESKMRVIYEAGDNFSGEFTSPSISVQKKYGIIKPYLIYVGNAYPHKNLESLVLAFSFFKKEKGRDYRLVLVGKNDYFYERLKSFVAEKGIDQVEFLSDVPDDDLDGLFRGAEANIFPSLYEGFGLPPLEAMSKGVPVASSDHPCMREVLGESAYFFDGNDIVSIQEAMNRVTNDPDLREKLIERGFQQVKKYSWERMAQETLQAYLGEK